MNKFVIIVVAVLVVLIYIYNWQSSDANLNTNKTIHQCIYENQPENYLINSNGIDFDIALAPNAASNCINPHFPAIHIKTEEPHNAWIHIVRTDSNNSELKLFVDKSNLQYPFYTFEPDFYDAPLWRYSLFSKSLSYWRGNAYAVMFDYDKKTIKFIGGVSWGFELSYLHIYPQKIIPKSLTFDDWKRDFPLFEEKLK